MVIPPSCDWMRVLNGAGSTLFGHENLGSVLEAPGWDHKPGQILLRCDWVEMILY